jgi:uncharacterized protein with PQ loop repeat
MTLHSLAIASGYLGAVLSVGMVVPQLARTIRNPGAGGVSPTSWALTMAACLTWLTFGVKAGATPQIPGNVLIFPGAAAIVLTAPSRLTVSLRAVMLVSASAAIVAAAVFLAPDYIGYLAFVIGLVSALPQARESIARSSSAGRSAVSVSAWLLRAVSQVFWLGYAIVLHQVPIIVAAGVTMISAIALVAAECRYRSQQRDAAVVAACP